MSAGKLGDSEILCIDTARHLQLAYPKDERTKDWGLIDCFSIESCQWCIAEYEAGRHPSYDDVLVHNNEDK